MVQLLAYALRLFLFGLTLAYLAYGVLYLPVALPKEFLSLLLGASQYVLALLLDVGNLRLHPCNLLLQLLFVLMYGLALALPIAFVAHDVLQILVALYIIRTHNLRGVTDYLFGDTRLARNLDGKRRARPSYRQLEEGSHLVAVV